MFPRLLLFLFMFTTTPLCSAQYFYFWADDYRVAVHSDDHAYINTYIKTDLVTRVSFSVNANPIAVNLVVLPDVVTNFPIVIGRRYTAFNDNVIVCTVPQAKQIQQICLNIRLTK